MRKSIIMTLAALFLTVAGNAQEKMKLLFKDGSVVTYNANDIQSFYFETEGEGIAPNCGIRIVDELALTTRYAMECVYEPEIEYVLARIYSPKANLDEHTDAELLEDLVGYGVRIEKTTTVITAGSLTEGTDLTIVFVGFNADGGHGPVYRHHFLTHVEAEEPMAKVTSCRYTSTEFTYEIEIDDSKVLSYYLFEELSDVLGKIHPAVFGMWWRKEIAADPDKGEYVYGQTFTVPRTEDETVLSVATWALDYDEQLAGAIFEGLYDINRASRTDKKEQTDELEIKAYNKEELNTMLKDINYKVIRPSF